jgi:glycosyltransferase involved in cell wall biosynthesis
MRRMRGFVPMRVAIIHYWLVGMRGGERVLEQFCHLFPDADIFTHVLRADQISAPIRAHRITCTSISRLPFASRLYPNYLPFMPMALEELDLSGYDLVISSESGPAKGVIVSPRARHICYCHSPMRYIWDYYHSYKSELGSPIKYVFGNVAHKMRVWDVSTAARVDRFVANSEFVAQRIERYYRRYADIIHPPVALECFSPVPAPSMDFYLLAGELVGYKRADLAISAFSRLDRPLVVVGDGPTANKLKKLATPNVRFLGRVSRQMLADLYANCKALIFPGEEDFGLVPLEAMASGRPVIAFASGGALETVLEYRTGIFFHEQSPTALRQAVSKFESIEDRFNPKAIRAHAANFSEAQFKKHFMALVTYELRQSLDRDQDTLLNPFSVKHVVASDSPSHSRVVVGANS